MSKMFQCYAGNPSLKYLLIVQLKLHIKVIKKII